jgi:hypothetical protein
LAKESNKGSNSSPPESRVSIVVPATDEDQVRNIVAASGGSALPGTSKYEPPAGERLNSTDPNFVPLLIIVTMLSAGYLAKTIFALWREVRYPGLVIVSKDGQTTIKENQALPGGTVVVVRADGAQVLTPTDESDLAKVLEHVLRP